MNESSTTALAVPTLEMRACDRPMALVPRMAVPRGDALTTSFVDMSRGSMRVVAVPRGDTNFCRMPVAVAATTAADPALMTVCARTTKQVSMLRGPLGHVRELMSALFLLGCVGSKNCSHVLKRYLRRARVISQWKWIPSENAAACGERRCDSAWSPPRFSDG